MLMIGSAAIRHHHNTFRAPKDYDFLVTPEELEQLGRTFVLKQNHSTVYSTRSTWGHFIELEVGVPSSSAATLLSKYSNSPVVSSGLSSLLGLPTIQVPSLSDLYAIKRSHIYFNIQWFKHIADLAYLAAHIDGFDRQLVQQRAYETKARLGARRPPSLMKNADNFFGQSSKYVYSFYKHDDIHDAIALLPGHYNKPLYTSMLGDGQSVWTDRTIWDTWDTERRIRCVMEEAYTLSLERWVLPRLLRGEFVHCEPADFSYEAAYKWSLMRIGTSITRGFFREWAIDHYFDCLDRYDNSYVDCALELL